MRQKIKVRDDMNPEDNCMDVALCTRPINFWTQTFREYKSYHTTHRHSDVISKHFPFAFNIYT